ncbi:hypothetical protein PW52_08255 [Tamlana sedimentorum]|uniref:DUF5000 domain-containing protein n=1 Tax=Neotamlana sedimentorum TaxID=1435349 RepID=A0A0D7W9E2_9FLAO|nr:DUF5000 domain-containing lipoprotein [Tamlana sedimentorum]KJD35724.1 hypothetical protein PW52_08255 [Tamlana sedimentorum]
MKFLKLILVFFYISVQFGCIDNDIEPSLEEELIDRVNYKAIYQAYDTPSIEDDWSLDYVFDGIIGNQGYYSIVDISEYTPIPEYKDWAYNGVDVAVTMFTLDLGKISQLTRFKFWQRDHFFYRHGNTKMFDLWGATELNEDSSLTWWTLLLENEEVIKPSGTLFYNENTAADIEAAEAGHEFLISQNMPKVRYIKFVQKLAWNNSTALLHMSEIEFYRYKEE